MMYFNCQCLTGSFISHSLYAGPKIIWHVCISIILHLLNQLFCVALSVLQPGQLDASIVCKSNFLFSCGSLITSNIVFSMFSRSVLGIPRSVGPSPWVTMNLAFLSFCLILYMCLIVQYLTDCMFLM